MKKISSARGTRRGKKREKETYLSVPRPEKLHTPHQPLTELLLSLLELLELGS